MNEAEEIEEETSKKTPLMWALVIITLILVSFFIGVRFFGEEEYPEIEYNGFRFQQIENMWYTQLQAGNKIYNLPLRFNPLELEDVQIHGKLSESFNQKDMYISFDPRNTTNANFTILALGAAELSLSLTQAMNINTIASCAYNISGVCDEIPIVTCEEKDKSVILLMDVGTPEILLYENCVILKGYDMNLLKSIDRFLYQLYGIMKND